MQSYRDIKKLSGESGEVWLCERDSDGAKFARKWQSQLLSFEAVARFRQEVRLLSRLRHPNVVEVVDQQLLDSPCWFVMPLYRSSLLAQLSEIVGQQTRIFRIFSSILRAIGHAHSQGIIHRDIKAANVLLNSDDDVVVSDFGIGRNVSIDSESTRYTASGQLRGTWNYMAPEQQTDPRKADERSDVYSLGRLLFELCMGEQTTPFTDTADLDPQIAGVIDKCVAVRPSKRYQAIDELQADWDDLVAPRRLLEYKRDNHNCFYYPYGNAIDLVPQSHQDDQADDFNPFPQPPWPRWVE